MALIMANTDDRETWLGRAVEHRAYGRGRVLIDLADHAHPDQWPYGQMRVEFNRSRRWVRARDCSLASR